MSANLFRLRLFWLANVLLETNCFVLILLSVTESALKPILFRWRFTESLQGVVNVEEIAEQDRERS
jgi:hypothetical protein